MGYSVERTDIIVYHVVSAKTGEVTKECRDRTRSDGNLQDEYGSARGSWGSGGRQKGTSFRP